MREEVGRGGDGGWEGREGGARAKFVFPLASPPSSPGPPPPPSLPDVISRRRAVVFKCLTCSTLDDVTNDVILPLGEVGGTDRQTKGSCSFI